MSHHLREYESSFMKVFNYNNADKSLLREVLRVAFCFSLHAGMPDQALYVAVSSLSFLHELLDILYLN